MPDSSVNVPTTANKMTGIAPSENTHDATRHQMIPAKAIALYATDTT